MGRDSEGPSTLDIEPIDLCDRCAEVILGVLVKEIPFERASTIVNGIRTHRRSEAAKQPKEHA
jgi:hypothetical protein